MARYKIEFKKSAVKELYSIPQNDLEKILTRIEKLADDPRPFGCIKLTAKEQYRIRQGNYRILYSINDDRLIIIVVKIAHRKKAYQ